MIWHFELVAPNKKDAPEPAALMIHRLPHQHDRTVVSSLELAYVARSFWECEC
jgi:hypothetical protein